MRCLITERKQKLVLAPGLLTIIEAAKTAGWSIKRGGFFVELARPSSGLDARPTYTINSNWWCRDSANTGGRAFRVTALKLIDLLGLPSLR